jgi:hypothetical protein
MVGFGKIFPWILVEYLEGNKSLRVSLVEAHVLVSILL